MTATVKMSEIARELTMNVRVTGLKMFSVRMWIGLRVMRIAAAIIGCKSRIDVDMP